MEGLKTSILEEELRQAIKAGMMFGLYVFVVTPNACHETFKLINSWSAVSSFAFADQLAFETNHS